MADVNLLRQALRSKLYFQQVSSMFDPRVAFSRCELHVSSKFAALKSFTRLSTLVDVEKCETLYTTASDDIKKVLSTSLNDESQTEARCAVELADIIAPLCREVLIENRYNGESFSPPIRMSSLGLGSSMTWHGCPDLRLRATSPGPEVNILISTSLPEDDEESEEEQDSDEDSMNVEITLFKNVRSQALATTVVASFINNNKHNITITPVLLMCKRHVYVCIYECVQDILFISESVKLSTDGVLCELGVAIIWVMLHCRCVLHESYLPLTYSVTRLFSGSFSLMCIGNHSSNQLFKKNLSTSIIYNITRCYKRPR